MPEKVEEALQRYSKNFEKNTTLLKVAIRQACILASFPKFFEGLFWRQALGIFFRKSIAVCSP